MVDLGSWLDGSNRIPTQEDEFSTPRYEEDLHDQTSPEPGKGIN